VESIEVIAHDHVEGRRDCALFLVTAHMHVVVIRPAVRQSMDQPRVAVVREDDRPVGREEHVELLVAQPVRVLTLRLKLHQVHHVNHPDLEAREKLPEQLNGSQRFQRGDVAAAGHHDVRLATLVVAGPRPDAKAGDAMCDRIVHVQPLGRRLLAGHDDIHIVAAP